MDEFLAAVGVQAMKYAIRSGIALTSTYALGQFSRLLKSVDDKKLHSELARLQKLLDSKIKVITPAIDLIDFKSGRGNVFLESAVPLTKALHQQINSLGRRIASAAAFDESTLKPASGTSEQHSGRHENICDVIADIRALLDRIDREIPLLQLAITASGESLSTSLPATISPSRLLQASTLLIVGDTQYAQDPTRPVQIGPAFNLSVYMLFLGHASQNDGTSDPDKGRRPVYGLDHDERKPLWQEVIHKAKVRLCRSAQNREPEGGEANSLVDGFNAPGESLEFAYHLEIIEDFDDGRVHDEVESSPPCGRIPSASIRETVPVHQLAKIFYADTGRILNIGKGEDGENNPVLLLKRDVKATQPRRAKEGMCNLVANVAEKDDDASACVEDEQADIDRQLMEESFHTESASLQTQRAAVPWPSRLPKHFDPEWIALEVYEGDDAGLDDSETDDGSETESEDIEAKSRTPRSKPAAQGALLDSKLAAQVRNLALSPSPGRGESQNGRLSSAAQGLEVDEAGALDFVARSPFKTITSSLSLVEMLIRLAGLQEFQQASHLSIPDHILTFFLEETSTTGLTGEARRTVRSEAKRRVGFDPYTDTPAA